MSNIADDYKNWSLLLISPGMPVGKQYSNLGYSARPVNAVPDHLYNFISLHWQS